MKDEAFREASPSDFETIVSMLRGDYEGDGYPFDEAAPRSAAAFIGDESLG